MSVKWTDEQTLAIETYDKGVVVPAAAGSGKTAVLVERIVRLLSDKEKLCPSEKLLAVTFTKDAAAQMKNKLSAALTARIVSEKDVGQRKWLQRQQDMLPLANVCTINSFCLELVRSCLHEFDYKNGLRIVDEAQAGAMLSEAVSEAIDELYERNTPAAELLSDSFTNGKKSELFSYIKSYYEFLRSIPFPDEWEAKRHASFEDESCVLVYLSAVFYDYFSKLEQAEKINESMMFTAKKMPDAKKFLDLCLNDHDIISSLIAPVLSENYNVLYKAAESLNFKRIPRLSKKGLTIEETIDQQRLYETFKNLRGEEKKFVSLVQEDLMRLGEDIISPMRHSHRIFSALSEAVHITERIMTGRKTERGTAEFSDVERMAVRLLINNENGRLKRTQFCNDLVRSRAYPAMLIDEFQDVNNLQELIFRALSDTEDMTSLGKNVFVVGDVKQSIYRFRLSNPRLFLNAVRDAENENNDLLRKVRLSSNFRSRRSVIDFVNMCFSELMSEETGEIDYTDEEFLKYGASYSGDDPPTEILIIGDDPETEKKYEKLGFGIEELTLARKIKRSLDSGVFVYGGSDKRRCEPGDFCVIARNKSALRRMTAALKYEGLKVQDDQTDGFMGSGEIVTMVNLLTVIDNPMKDMEMAAVMLSPLMSFTADQTARLRKLCFQKTGGERKTLYQIILAVSKDDQSDEREAERIFIDDNVLTEKCRSAAQLIRRLRFYSVSMTLEELISRIYDETDFFAAASAYENASQKRANLRLLTQRAAEYERNDSGGVSGFLRYLKSVSESGGDFSQASLVTSGKNAVAVKTIHGSKGLEYPFVYLCGLTKKFNMTDVTKSFLAHERYGVGINYMRHARLDKTVTAAHRALEIYALGEMLSEELRLLYVALTRAKEQLVIPIFLKSGTSANNDVKKLLVKLAETLMKNGGINPSVVRSCKSYLEWISAVIMVSEFNVPLLTALQIEDCALELSQFSSDRSVRPCVSCEYISCESGWKDEKPDYSYPAPDSEEVEKLRRRYEFSYPNADAYAAAKRTVTEIVSEILRRENEESDRVFYPKLPSLDEERERLTGAQRGTYTHLFMELADYASAEKDVGAEIDRLRKMGMMSEKEAGGVYVSAVNSFFSGDFYKRMKISADIRREFKFMVCAGDINLRKEFSEFIASDGMLQGICDCIFEEEDGFVLVDYKTDGFTDISELDKYSVQLELYKSALDIILPKPVKACYIYSFRLSLGKEIKFF